MFAHTNNPVPPEPAFYRLHVTLLLFEESEAPLLWFYLNPDPSWALFPAGGMEAEGAPGHTAFHRTFSSSAALWE